MNSDISTLSRYDGFSWKRVAMLGRYYSPGYSRMLLIFFLLSLVTAVLWFIFPGRFFSLSALSNILDYCCAFAPVVFLARSDRDIFTSLPVLTSEKFVFFVLNIFVVFPAVCFLLPTAARYLSGADVVVLDDALSTLREVGQESLVSFFFTFKPMLYVFSLALSLGANVTVLWAGWTARRLRVVKGILMYFLFVIATGLAIGILAVSISFDQFASAASGTIDATAIAYTIKISVIAMFALILAYLCFALVMFYRSLANRKG